LLLLAGAAALAPASSADTVGSDLEALNPTRTIVCPRSEACIVAQALGGNGTPFSPPTGVIASWSVKFGPVVPDGIRLVVQRATGTGGAGQGRRTIDVGSPRRSLTPNRVNTFSERLPVHGDEAFGVRLEAANRSGTRATIAAPFNDEYKTMLLWDPPPPFGSPSSPLADRIFENARIAISVDVVPPSPRRCAPLNTYTGSRHGDDYGGFLHGGDVIHGVGGNDSLRSYRGDDCVYGGRGDDRMAGMDGADLLDGGPGRDDIGAGEGSDRILVRDGERDTVRCGGGFDSVRADGLDRVSGCERVRRG
jgi:hypothetical protein